MMEVALYGGSSLRAVRFWEQAKKAEARPGTDALEVFLWCVMLGFRGEPSAAGINPPQWIEGVRKRVLTGYTQEFAQPPEKDPPTFVPVLRGRERFGTMLRVAAARRRPGRVRGHVPAGQGLPERRVRSDRLRCTGREIPNTMNSVYQFILDILNKIRSWIGLIFPMFATAADFRHWPRWVWRTIHVLLVIGVLVGLWYLNRYFDIGRLADAADRSRCGQFYLPMLFLLLYALSWLGYWLYRLLGEEDAAAEFPDVDDAWREACAKLEAQGIGLADAPLYLILGRPAAGDDALFQAAEQQVAVRAPAASRRPAPRLRAPGRHLRHLRRRVGVGPVRRSAGRRGRGRRGDARDRRRRRRRQDDSIRQRSDGHLARDHRRSCANSWPSSSSAT